MFSSQDDFDLTPRDEEEIGMVLRRESSMVGLQQHHSHQHYGKSPARKRNKGRSALCFTRSDSNTSGIHCALLEMNHSANYLMENSDSNNSADQPIAAAVHDQNSVPFPAFINLSQESTMSLSQLSQDFADRLGTMRMTNSSTTNFIQAEEEKANFLHRTISTEPQTGLLFEDSNRFERKGSENSVASDGIFATPNLPSVNSKKDSLFKGNHSIRKLSTAFLKPSVPQFQPSDQNYCPNRMSTRSTSKSLSMGAANMESPQRQVELPDVLFNPFSRASNNSVEYYFYPKSSTESSSSPMKMKTTKKGKGKQASMIWVDAFKERPRYFTDFEEVMVLGEGTFSTVYCARQRNDGLLYAIKKIKQPILSQSHKAHLLKEVQILSYLNVINCPNIIKYYSNWIFDQILFIQTELCCYGSLEDLISSIPSKTSIVRSCLLSLQRKSGNRWSSDLDLTKVQLLQDSSTGTSDSYVPSVSESQSTDQPTQNFFPINTNDLGISEQLGWKIIQEMCKVLMFLHERGFVHLDIRPANIFLQSNPQKISFKSFADQQKDQHDSNSNVSTTSTNSSLSFGESLFASILKAKPLGLSHSLGSYEEEEDCEESPYPMIRRKVESAIISSDYILKLGDFGHCHHIDDPKRTIEEGETRYCARELIVDDFQTSEEHKLDLTKCDIFSLGASVYELCLGRFLLRNEDVKEKGEEDQGEMKLKPWHALREGFLDPTFLKNYSPEFVALIRNMLDANPQNRWNAITISQACLNHSS